MMLRYKKFKNVKDQGILARLLRSQDIKVLNRFEFFEAVNARNGHIYKVKIAGDEIRCSCKDAERNACKHEMAVCRDLPFFEVESWN